MFSWCFPCPLATSLSKMPFFKTHSLNPCLFFIISGNIRSSSHFWTHRCDSNFQVYISRRDSVFQHQTSKHRHIDRTYIYHKPLLIQTCFPYSFSISVTQTLLFLSWASSVITILCLFLLVASHVADAILKRYVEAARVKLHLPLRRLLKGCVHQFSLLHLLSDFYPPGGNFKYKLECENRPCDAF